MTLTVSVVHSCFTLYEKLLLHFINFLQTPEGSRTRVLMNLQPLIGEALHQRATLIHTTHRPLCSLNDLQMSAMT